MGREGRWQREGGKEGKREKTERLIEREREGGGGDRL